MLETMIAARSIPAWRSVSALLMSPYRQSMPSAWSCCRVSGLKSTAAIRRFIAGRSRSRWRRKARPSRDTPRKKMSDFGGAGSTARSRSGQRALSQVGTPTNASARASAVASSWLKRMA